MDKREKYNKLRSERGYVLKVRTSLLDCIRDMRMAESVSEDVKYLTEDMDTLEKLYNKYQDRREVLEREIEELYVELEYDPEINWVNGF